MGMLKNLLIEFEGLWEELEALAWRGKEAEMIPIVDEADGTLVRLLHDADGNWSIWPGGLFDGLRTPIQVAPNFRDRVNSYHECITPEEAA
jgi:hypothetical protein